MAIAVFANLVYLYWSEPGLVPKPTATWELLKMSPIQRAAKRINPWTVDENVALARETNVKRGDLVVYTDSFLFVSTHWNETFSNLVEWWPSAPALEFKQQLDSRNAKWVVTGRSSALAQSLSTDPKWRKVGRMCDLSDAFERVGK